MIRPRQFLCKKKLVAMLLALLVGVGVGLVITFLIWSVPTLARFLVQLSVDFSPFDPGVDFMLALMTGALAIGFLIKLTPHVAGPGISEARWIISDQQGNRSWYLLPLKLLSTVICVGTGGGGLVGPSYFTGTATGVSIGKLLHLRDTDMTKFLALIGTSAGVSAVLKSPIGGALVALESLGYKKEGQWALNWTVESLIASLSAYLTVGILLGFSPLLYLEASTPLNFSLATLIQILIAGLFAGLAAKAYIELFRGVGRLWRGKVPIWAQPAIGALLAGPLILLLSTGTSSAIQPFEIGRPGLAPLQDALLGKLEVWVIINLAFGKVVEVALRSGSGGSVGVFGPAMWVGGLSGAVVSFLHGFQSTPLFAVSGIAAGIVAAMEFPLAAAVIVIEIFGGGMVVPSVIGSIMGALVWLRWNRLLKKEKQS